MTEEWRDIPGYEGYYQASDRGRIRSLDRMVESRGGPHERRLIRGQVLQPAKKKYGYLQLVLNRDGVARTWRVHQLVALSFIGPRPDGMHVCHNDGDPSNNTIKNLRYDTPESNSADMLRHGRNVNKAKTHCDSGHEFTDENTILTIRSCRKNASRRCRECKNISERIRYAKRRDAKLNPAERKVIQDLRKEREHATLAAR